MLGTTLRMTDQNNIPLEFQGPTIAAIIMHNEIGQQMIGLNLQFLLLRFMFKYLRIH